MILFLIIITIIAFMGKYIYDLHNFNLNATIQQLQSSNSMIIQDKLKDKNPLIIHNLGTKYENLHNYTFERLIEQNPGYIINHNQKFISLESFGDETIQQMNIYKNQKLIHDLNLQDTMKDIIKPFTNQLTCNENYSLSLLKGKNTISLTQNKRNLLLIYQISGKSTLYLFNPKHKEDIINKENNEIKKWSHKINLEEGLIVSIPSEWYYFYECENISIVSSLEYDTYFTYLYNLLR